ncbi:MAG: ribosome small subunit-dependent GTPase A [Burkholderiaceae bacterium]
MSTLVTGQVLAAQGRQFWVRLDDGSECTAVTRGRQSDVVTGDQVRCLPLGSGQAVIDAVLPRRNRMRRSDQRREKTIAANLDQAAFVLSGEPLFSEDLLLRVLISARREGIGMMVVATKADLPQSMERIAPRLELLERLGIKVHRVASRADPAGTVAQLLPDLKQRNTLLLGQSGMGKSTLINLLVPGADLRTQAISEALQTGRHTTTFTRAFDLAEGGLLLDSPGFQVFGLAHLSVSELEHAMPEFEPLLGHCRFHNCSHRHEPGCAILNAVGSGGIDAIRHELWTGLRDEADRSR